MATEKDFRVKSSIDAPTSIRVGVAEITATGSAIVLPANSVISDGAGGTVSIETDLTGYATETYVNTQISNIDYSSYATQTDLTNGLATKVNTSSIATVALTGNYNDLSNKPTIPSLTGYATETYVNTQVSNLVDSAPGALDTLNELAAALGDDANFSTTITNSLALKAPLASPAFTGSVTVQTTSTLPSNVWAGGTEFIRLYAGPGSTYAEPSITFKEGGADIGAKISTKNKANGAMDIIFANRNTSSITSTLTEKMRITDSGNVGIGTNSPSHALTVNGTTNTNSSIIRLTSNEGSGLSFRSLSATKNNINVDSGEELSFSVGGTDIGILTSSGNFGIGTNSINTTFAPRMEVYGTANDGTHGLLISTFAPTLTFLDRSGSGTTYQIKNDSAILSFLYENGATGSFTERMRMNSDGSLTLNAGSSYRLDIGTPTATSARITCDNTPMEIGTFDGHALEFLTTNTERMRITSTGNVGIGTSTPEGFFNVSTNVTSTAFFDSSYGGLSIVSSRSTNTSGVPTFALRSWSTWTSAKDTGQIRFDGLTSTGSYTVYGNIYVVSDTNTSTGAASTMKFSTSDGTSEATERMCINSSGNVGIGTSSPSSPLSFANATGEKITLYSNYSLGVESSEFRFATNGIFAFRTGGYSGTERMRIDSSGNVGIGTTSPAAKLEIFSGSSGSDALRIESSKANGVDDLYGEIVFSHNSSFPNNGSAIQAASFYNDAGDLRFLTSYASSRTERMRITTQGNVGIGTSSPNNSYKLTLSGATTGVVGGVLLDDTSESKSYGIYTALSHLIIRDVTSAAERMRITSAGNVGIGTSSPNVPLCVGTVNTQSYGNTAQFNGTTPSVAAGSGQVSIGSTDSAAADKGGVLNFSANTTTLNGYSMGFIAGKHETLGAGNYSSYLQFATTSSAGTVAERMRITSSGNVGIGTSSPTFKLDVSGIARATSYLETVYAVTGTTPAISANSGNIQTWTLSGNSTPTDSLAAGQSVTLMIDDGAAYTITWTSLVDQWIGGSAPTLATSGYTVVELWKVGGVTYAAYVGDLS